MLKGHYAMTKAKGFTLLELAISMIIVGIMVSGSFSLLRPMVLNQKRKNTLQYLEETKETILAHALSKGRLPGSDHDKDGKLDGVEDDFCKKCKGGVPYVTLQIRPNDAYKRRLKYMIDKELWDLDYTRGDTCAVLRDWPGLAEGNIDLVDAEYGVTEPINPAFILVSSGLADADKDGDVFDKIKDENPSGDNTDGKPQYIRHPPDEVKGFDDMIVYVGGQELQVAMECGKYDFCREVKVDNLTSSLLWYKDKEATPVKCKQLKTGNKAAVILPYSSIEVYTKSNCDVDDLLPGLQMNYGYHVDKDSNLDCETGIDCDIDSEDNCESYYVREKKS